VGLYLEGFNDHYKVEGLDPTNDLTIRKAIDKNCDPNSIKNYVGEIDLDKNKFYKICFCRPYSYLYGFP